MDFSMSPTEKNRIKTLQQQHENHFPESQNPSLFSVAGRIEVGGNHTDHQLGKVLCASIHLDSLALAGPRQDGKIILYSQGYEPIILESQETTLRPDEKNSTLSLIRGICFQFQELGYKLGGFQATITSNVLQGSGMSSSASFEGLISVIINEFFCDNQVSLVELAKIGQFAEKEYFGKPCGLMDQLACLLGGFVYIDFYQEGNPEIQIIDSSLLAQHYDVCIIDTGDAHDDLTAEYGEITQEMGEIAQFFQESHLSRVSVDVFFQAMPELLSQFGQRSILRALHFFKENTRVELEKRALQQGKLEEFLALVTESGQSSALFLQNIYANKQPQIQGATLLLALCQHLLQGEGAYRIHGGGFGGTVQAFVPKEKTTDFQKQIHQLTGRTCCHVVSIRNHCGGRVKAEAGTCPPEKG